MTALETRIRALEVGSTFDATKSEVVKVEEEFLVKLRAIRQVVAASEGGGAGAASSDLEALQKENEELKRKNAKLEYRVLHVVSEMEKLYQEHKK